MVFGSRPLPARPQFQMFGGTLITGSGIVLLALATRLPHAWLLPGMTAVAAMPAAVRASVVANSAGVLAAPAAFAAFGLVPVVVLCGASLVGVAAFGLLRHGGWVERPEGEAAQSIRGGISRGFMG